MLEAARAAAVYPESSRRQTSRPYGTAFCDRL
jgi:hypothetical protein